MSLKKLSPIALLFMLAITVSACSKQNDTTDKVDIGKKQEVEMKVSDSDKEYGKKYNELYKKYISNLAKFDIYSDEEKAEAYFNKNEYPGNKKYLNNLKEAYSKSKEGISSFISELKADTKIENPSLKAMNEELIVEAELTIMNIDEMLNRINQIPKEIEKTSKEEFIEIVNKTADLADEKENEFEEMIEYMNEKINKKS
ncbi:MAG: hypothetical protein ACRC3Y_12840 [Romboutsia sp.]|uniref:hypothetical protein n=1 Tax=Romboutsia sp. TaxID=1965302 RepID=UPI003F399445